MIIKIVLLIELIIIFDSRQDKFDGMVLGILFVLLIIEFTNVFRLIKDKIFRIYYVDNSEFPYMVLRTMTIPLSVEHIKGINYSEKLNIRALIKFLINYSIYPFCVLRIEFTCGKVYLFNATKETYHKLKSTIKVTRDLGSDNIRR